VMISAFDLSIENYLVINIFFESKPPKCKPKVNIARPLLLEIERLDLPFSIS